MRKQYGLNLDFHENGRLKRIEAEYDSEYGNLTDILTNKTVDEVIKLIEVNIGQRIKDETNREDSR